MNTSPLSDCIVFGTGGPYFQQPTAIPTCISRGSVLSPKGLWMELGFVETRHWTGVRAARLWREGPSSLNH